MVLPALLTIDSDQRTASSIDHPLRPIPELGGEVKRRGQRTLRSLPATMALHVLDGITDAVIACDNDWHCIYLNREAERLLGKTREQVLKHTIWQSAPFLLDETFARLADRARQCRNSVDWETFAAPLAQWVSVRVQPVGDWLLVYLRDRTEHNLALGRVRDHEILLDDAWQVAGVGSWILELIPEKRLIWSEQLYRIFGIAPGEFDGRLDTFLKFVHPDDLPAVLAARGRADRECEPYNSKYRIIRPDGEVRWVHSYAHVVDDVPGRPAHYVGIVHDITSYEALERQVHDAQRLDAIGQLAGGIAHDFNNLLTAITGYTDMLLEEMSEEDARRQYVVEVEKAAQRGARLTRQILAFGRRQMVQPRVLDLNRVIEETLHMLRRLVPANVAFSVRLAPDLGRVKVDQAQIEEILLNLVLNAGQAMPEGGTLFISTCSVDLATARQEFGWALPGEAYVALSVRDTGIGMDDSTRARIFEPFFTTKDRDCGTGLGLSTVYGIVKQNRGGISVASRLGRGSTFRVALPSIDEPASPEARPELTPVRAARSELVLVVEDDETVRSMAQRTLERFGYQVLAASCAEEAFSAVSGVSRPIDLMLCDAVLPGLSGRRVADRLRDRWPDLRVLYMSGYADRVPTERALLELDAPFMPKPFSAWQLVSRVRSLLDTPAPCR